MPRFRLEDLQPLIAPTDPEQLRAWRGEAATDVKFLRTLIRSDEIIVHARGPAFLVVGALAPRSKLITPDWSDLESQNMPWPHSTWSIQYVQSGRGLRRVYLEPPLGSGTSRTFEGGEPLFFLRRMESLADAPRAIEINQKLVHALRIHYHAPRNAYCRIDEAGDLEDVVRILRGPSTDDDSGLCAIAVRRQDLEEFMAVTDTSVVLRFDITRAPQGFGGWAGEQSSTRCEDMTFNAGTGSGGSYANGALIVPGTKTVDDLIEEWRRRDDPAARQYASFKVFDWKNRKAVETSCGPGHLSNYFETSELPYELSPAFFRASVLHKYKADAEKYDLQARSISCRSAWHLETYDINGEGLVHTYVGYLARLPFEEQLYWQSFNVWPEEGVGLRELISSRAFKTDFEGSWDLVYDPVEALKRKVREWNARAPQWWQPRPDALLDAVHHPATDSIKEWGDELVALDQLLVEGLLEKKLQTLATERGVTFDARWRALKMLEAILAASDGKERAKEAMSGLFVLHDLRSIVRGHATGTKGQEAVQQARTQHGSLRAHFRALAERCDEALTMVTTVLLPGASR
jgi:hypothetical protein